MSTYGHSFIKAAEELFEKPSSSSLGICWAINCACYGAGMEAHLVYRHHAFAEEMLRPRSGSLWWYEKPVRGASNSRANIRESRLLGLCLLAEILKSEGGK